MRRERLATGCGAPEQAAKEIREAEQVARERTERLQHIMGWFDKWIMGASKPEYEIGEVTRSTTTQQ